MRRGLRASDWLRVEPRADGQQEYAGHGGLQTGGAWALAKPCGLLILTILHCPYRYPDGTGGRTLPSHERRSAVLRLAAGFLPACQEVCPARSRSRRARTWISPTKRPGNSEKTAGRVLRPAPALENSQQSPGSAVAVRFLWIIAVQSGTQRLARGAPTLRSRSMLSLPVSLVPGMLQSYGIAPRGVVASKGSSVRAGNGCQPRQVRARSGYPQPDIAGFLVGRGVAPVCKGN
jgi:hypothetical protein